MFNVRYMQPLVSKVPIMVVEGNHEIEQQAENQTFVAYSSRFAFPSEESGSSSTFYYSFNAGGIHFIMLGAYISYNKPGELKFSFIFSFFIASNFPWSLKKKKKKKKNLFSIALPSHLSCTWPILCIWLYNQ